MKNIDLIDRKILSELDFNSRQPFSLLAKKVRCSRTVAEYRVRRMREEGIISSLAAFVDPAKFGYTSWKVYVQFQEHNLPFLHQIEEYLKNHPKFWWVIKCEGSFDLMFCVLAKSVHDFYQELDAFQMKFSKYESRIEITSHINPDFFSRGYLLNKESKKVCATFLKEPSVDKVDEIDLKILKMLLQDARLPSTEMALKLKTTPRIINYRIKELLKRKIITHFRLIPNVNKLGMDYYKVMLGLKDLNSQQQAKLRQYLEVHPNIINYSNSWGPWEMEFEAEIEGFKELTNLINKIREEFSEIIKKVEFVLITEEFKANNDFLDVK
ncbi:MAG: winged helix-turn-helix transcriptional regulator [Candidatus Woesearchaeota archaeon]